MLVMLTTGIALATLSATWSWNATSTTLNDRNNHYFSALAAAEAATEKIVSDITADYYYGGPNRVAQRLALYESTVPTSAEHPHWSRMHGNGRPSARRRIESLPQSTLPRRGGRSLWPKSCDWLRGRWDG